MLSRRRFAGPIAALTVVLAAAFLPGVSGSPAVASDLLFRDAGSFDRSAAKVRVTPDDARVVTVDLSGVRAALSKAPAEGRGGATTFAIPRPDGGSERFALQRTSVMESKLAAAHPEIATYAGRSLDHPGSTVAVDITPMGFHAFVRGANGQDAYYVDPAYNLRGTTKHLVYYGDDVDATDVDSFVERETPAISNKVATASAPTPAGGVVKQRIYRLALTSDPSYAKYFGTANVLAEKATLINRVNEIYNDDMAIHLVLVNGTPDLNLDTDAKATGPNGPCGAHPCFDPKDPNDPDSASQIDFCDVPTLGRNRTVLGQIIGASNYDIGHIALGVNGGGIAYLGVVGTDFKGGGCTGLPQPKGDFFAIDYVAHEMGHQFAGNHTFNGVQYACAGGNRNAGTSVEPGSGSSVMAYAGICLQDDLQPHTDPYFSQRTIKEVTAYTSNPAQSGNEVQTVSLEGFDTDGEQITLTYPGATPVTLTRGVDYNRAGIEGAIETMSGKNVTVAGWGYDPFSDPVKDIKPLTAPDDTGFQVIFAPNQRPFVPAGEGDVPMLQVSSPSSGVSGFVGETAQGGASHNTGNQVVTTTNHAPSVQAPKKRTIPIRTPFKLQATGKDRDGDKLIYLWEQNDTGAGGGTGLVSNFKKFGPLFRVFGRYARVSPGGTLQSPSPHENVATGSPVRWFPDLSQVLAGNTNAATSRCPKVGPLPNDLSNFKPVKRYIVECYSEFLPTRAYVGRPGKHAPAMHFRVTARDSRTGGGGTSYADVTLKIDRSAGPFLVTSQKGGTVKGGHRIAVRWAVNGTRKLAANVRIRYSADGGKTWRTILGKTANDGAVSVRVPQGATKRARIMVAANDNYFYAVNTRGFRVTR